MPVPDSGHGSCDDDDRPQRIAAAVSAFASPSVLQDIHRLGRQFEQWLLGFQLSAAFAVARAQNQALTLADARGNLAKLLQLAELETAFNLAQLPAAIAVVCRQDERKARRAQEWCLRMLEAQGPFFPKVMALEILGELRAVIALLDHEACQRARRAAGRDVGTGGTIGVLAIGL